MIEEMHAALKALGKPPAENLATDDPDDGVDRAALAAYKAYADEYEINDKLNVADKWHQERLLLTRRHPDVWSDYAAFCARRGRRGKAEEAYKEALQLDGEHAPSLLGLTVLTMCDEEYQRAEVYAHAATTSARASSADPAAWALLAATYEGLEREEDAANCDFEARRLAAEVMSHVFDDARPSPAQPDAFEAAALACLDLACAAPASKVLDMSPAARRGEPDGITRALCLARCAMLSKAHDTAYAHLMRALEVDATDPRPFELLGDVHYACGRFKEAQEGYTHALALSGGVDNVGRRRSSSSSISAKRRWCAAGSRTRAACSCPRAGCPPSRPRGSAPGSRCAARATSTARRLRSRRPTCSTRPTRTSGGTSASSRCSPSASTRLSTR